MVCSAYHEMSERKQRVGRGQNVGSALQGGPAAGGRRSTGPARAGGESPYLPVLDELVPGELYTSCESLGLIQVLKRSSLSVPNRRAAPPHLPATTCRCWRETSGLPRNGATSARPTSRGIRDPVKVYEYRNRFYVEEGNKRVSVLNFSAPSPLPPRSGGFCPAQWRSGWSCTMSLWTLLRSQINFLEFTKPGGYAELQRLMGKEPDEGVEPGGARSRFITTTIITSGRRMRPLGAEAGHYRGGRHAGLYEGLWLSGAAAAVPGGDEAVHRQGLGRRLRFSRRRNPSTSS